MRLLVDSLIALMLAAVLAGVFLHHRREEMRNNRYEVVRRGLATLHEQAVSHAGLDPETGRYEFPEVIVPDWFRGAVPVNVLIQGRHPWIDVAPPGDRNDHPPDPIITEGEQAGFWYNPNKGAFRARVPRQFSDQRTLELYNTINGVALHSLPVVMDVRRKPIAMTIPSNQSAQTAPDESVADPPPSRTISTPSTR